MYMILPRSRFSGSTEFTLIRRCRCHVMPGPRKNEWLRRVAAERIQRPLSVVAMWGYVRYCERLVTGTWLLFFHSVGNN